MTFKVSLAADCLSDPTLHYDLDEEDDWDAFEKLDFVNLTVHLFPGQTIIIKCLERSGCPEDKI